MFKVGDKVRAFGLDGVVRCITFSGRVVVRYSDLDLDEIFTLDGKAETHHKEPSLILVERPKVKVTKTIEKWLNVYPSQSGGLIYYNSESTANLNASSDRVACVKLTGTYEVEE